MAKACGPKGRNIAHLPDGSRLYLQDWDPMAGESRSDLAKAAAVAMEFGLVFECTLDEAAAVYERILHATTRDVSLRLLQRAKQHYQDMKVTASDPGAAGKATKFLH